MLALEALTQRTRRRHQHRTKAPTLVHLQRATKLRESSTADFTNLNLRIRAGQHWVVLSQDHDSCNALLQCVAGFQQPDQGTITIRGHVSWPLGQVAGLSNKLSCAENSRFLVGIYGQRGEREQELAMVQGLMNLSHDHWHSPLVKLSGDIRSRLKLALSLACDFDLYLIDSLALRKFRQSSLWSTKWQDLLDHRLQTRAVLSAGMPPFSRNEETAKGLVLDKGNILMKGTLADCQAYFQRIRGAQDLCPQQRRA